MVMMKDALGRDRNVHMSPEAGRPRPAVIGDRVTPGGNRDERVSPGGPVRDKGAGLRSMQPLSADPHARGAPPSGHISDGIRAKLGEHPAQAGHIRDVAGRR
jgi:hypothetical protein